MIFRDDGLEFWGRWSEIWGRWSQTEIQFQGSGTAFSTENGEVKSVMVDSPNFSSILDSAYLLTSQTKFKSKH